MTKKSHKILAWSLLLAAGWLFVTQYLFVSGTWRYKMTVVVETPEGIKTGSAVREISSVDARYGFDLPGVGNSPELKGEAVVVDLGDRGVLFALLNGKALGQDHAKSIVYYALPYEDGYTTVDGILHYRSLKNAKATLTPEQYPMLVAFSNLDDPKSVKEVMPENMAAAFGEGVKIDEIIVEMTSERVTWEIERVIKWLPNRKANIDGTSVTNSRELSNELHSGNFIRRK